MGKLNYTCKSNREQRGLIRSQHVNQVIKLGYVILCDQCPQSYRSEQGVGALAEGITAVLGEGCALPPAPQQGL